MFTRKYFDYLLILAAIVLSWFPVLLVPFLNDDYQILGYHFNTGITELLKPFWTPDISGFYWRPVGNLVHPIILLITGFTPLPFRIASVLIFFLCCIVLYRFLLKFNLSVYTVLAAVLFFAVLPSHEFQIAWIADQGECLVTMALFGSFIFYYRANEKINNEYLIISGLFFIIALLIKESAFAGVFIPLIYLILKGDYKKEKITKSFINIVYAIVILLLLLLYRYFVIGGTPFSSNHFENGGIVKWFINSLIYIPLSFLSAEILDLSFYYLHNPVLAVLCLIIIIPLVYLFIKIFKKLDAKEKNIFFAGLAWFIIFIVPALPTLMRWYSFTASAGLIISGAVIFNKIWTDYRSKILIVLAALFFISAIYYDFSLMLRWKASGDKLGGIIKNLREDREAIKSDSLFVIGIPDKLDGIPMMKLGVKETFQWALNNKKLEIFAPLRTELANENANVKLVSADSASLVLELTGGRFIRERSPSKIKLTNEDYNYKYEGNEYTINTRIDNDGYPVSIVKIVMMNKYNSEIMFFNGDKFLELTK